ncbi:MAG: hypothetical protein GYB67_08780 [Chloroflexi bacterium]|nr:hypothetical protein [Chloroflexota bacterium]
MTVVEIGEPQNELTQRQRWSHYFVLLYALVAVVIGINLRDAALNASAVYTNVEAGIRAQYPQRWLIDTDGDYIFRVRDMTRIGFKTTIQVATRPIARNTTVRNLVDSLTLDRSQTLAAYGVINTEPFMLPNEVEATAMTYTYVQSELNPYLQSLPTVIEGLDILTVEGDQAIIITFLSEVSQYEQTLPIFERFLGTLEF